jgi:hypothetical protein
MWETRRLTTLLQGQLYLYLKNDAYFAYLKVQIFIFLTTLFSNTLVLGTRSAVIIRDYLTRMVSLISENPVSTPILRQFILVVYYDFDVELRLSPRWVGGNIGSTDATKTRHNLNAYIFETNNNKVINNTSLDSS